MAMDGQQLMDRKKEDFKIAKLLQNLYYRYFKTLRSWDPSGIPCFPHKDKREFSSSFFSAYRQQIHIGDVAVTETYPNRTYFEFEFLPVVGFTFIL